MNLFPRVFNFQLEMWLVTQSKALKVDLCRET